jgi:P pilus assembly chaperone PapD
MNEKQFDEMDGNSSRIIEFPAPLPYDDEEAIWDFNFDDVPKGSRVWPPSNTC